MFDHPRNVRHPATWFTMTAPFAYLCATLNLHRQPLVLEADRGIHLVYGVAAWDGQPTDAQINALYQRWLKLVPKPQTAAP
jgi:hypothetical protein